jgi:hypothetical protein
METLCDTDVRAGGAQRAELKRLYGEIIHGRKKGIDELKARLEALTSG